jgi:hypothetical protein
MTNNGFMLGSTKILGVQRIDAACPRGVMVDIVLDIE